MDFIEKKNVTQTNAYFNFKFTLQHNNNKQFQIIRQRLRRIKNVSQLTLLICCDIKLYQVDAKTTETYFVRTQRAE